MYAVIATGGKQYRVEEGQRLDVERVGSVGDDVSLDAVLIVDDGTVIAGRSALDAASVSATVVAEVAGPKIDGFTYKNKSNQRRRWGHRQQLNTIEITGITKG